MNYLIWNGKDSRDIKGLVICELPPISKPVMRIAETFIEGVDGSFIEELGYDPYDKYLTIGLTPSADIDQVLRYFSGSGEVVFSNEPNKYYKASIIGQIDYTRLVRFKVATVTFRVQPFKYEHMERNSALRLNEYRGKNLFNGNKLSSSSGVTSSFEDGILTLTSTGTTSRYAGMYNFDAGEGETIRVSTVLMDANCHLILQEYTPDFMQVGQVYAVYTDGETPSVLEYQKKNKNNRTRLVIYTDINTPTGERVARYKNTIITVNNADITYEEYETENIINSLIVENVGNYVAKPVIELKGTGEVDFSVNGNEIFHYTFDDDNSVVIDSQKQDAYWEEKLKNRNMMGEFPVLEIGENTLTWEGVVTTVVVSAKSRWL